jgi:serine/threonine protein kinase
MDKGAIHRFATAYAVNHPNICQIYEVGEETEALFIVMELLEGESLARRLRCGPLAVDRFTYTKNLSQQSVGVSLRLSKLCPNL